MFVVLPSADPALLRAGRNPTPELVAAIRENLGLDKPWYVQYVDLHAGPGPALRLRLQLPEQHRRPRDASSTACRRPPRWPSAPPSSWLLIGIPIGIISAIKRGTLLDRAAMGFALMAISAPVYWVGLVSIYLFSEDLGKLAPIFKGSGAVHAVHGEPGRSGPRR